MTEVPESSRGAALVFPAGSQGVLSLLWVHTYLSSYAEQPRCVQPPFLAGPDGRQRRQVGVPLPHLGQLLLLHLQHRKQLLLALILLQYQKVTFRPASMREKSHMSNP